jgi:hypothetical protein
MSFGFLKKLRYGMPLPSGMKLSTHNYFFKQEKGVKEVVFKRTACSQGYFIT